MRSQAWYTYGRDEYKGDPFCLHTCVDNGIFLYLKNSILSIVKRFTQDNDVNVFADIAFMSDYIFSLCIIREKDGFVLDDYRFNYSLSFIIDNTSDEFDVSGIITFLENFYEYAV